MKSFPTVPCAYKKTKMLDYCSNNDSSTSLKCKLEKISYETCVKRQEQIKKLNDLCSHGNMIKK